MIKKFKVKETNIKNCPVDTFECETKISTHSNVIDDEPPFRCFMYNGRYVKLVREDEYILGEPC